MGHWSSSWSWSSSSSSRSGTGTRAGAISISIRADVQTGRREKSRPSPRAGHSPNDVSAAPARMCGVRARPHDWALWVRAPARIDRPLVPAGRLPSGFGKKEVGLAGRGDVGIRILDPEDSSRRLRDKRGKRNRRRLFPTLAGGLETPNAVPVNRPAVGEYVPTVAPVVGNTWRLSLLPSGHQIVVSCSSVRRDCLTL